MAQINEKERLLIVAKAKKKIEDLEKKMPDLAFNGVTKIKAASVLHEKDKYTDTYTWTIMNHFKKEGFNVYYVYEHDGVGISSWYSLYIDWNDEEKTE